MLDATSMLGQLFPFVRISDLAYLANFLLISSATYQGYIAASFACCAATAAVSARFAKKQNPYIALSTLITATTIYMPYAYSDQPDKFWKIASSQIIGSQAVYIFTNRTSTFLDGYNMEGKALSTSRIAGASNDLFTNPNNLPRKILLIVNESWGEANNKKINQAILEPLVKTLSDAHIKTGTIAFTGATLAGELRELCHLRPNHFNLRNVTDGFEGCIPNKLAALGYKTISLHAAMSVMYDRKYWYPRAGFQQSIFFESKNWQQRCYSFPGACDSDLAHLIPPLFREDKVFAYWLSLNTHSTYDARDIKIDGFNCEGFEIPHNSETCRNLKLQWQFFHTIANLNKNPNMRGTRVIVVGDHPPPIFDQHEKSKYFMDATIPWISFQIPAI